MRLLLVDDHPMNQDVLGAVARGVFGNALIDFASDLGQAIGSAG